MTNTQPKLNITINNGRFYVPLENQTEFIKNNSFTNLWKLFKDLKIRFFVDNEEINLDNRVKTLGKIYLKGYTIKSTTEEFSIKEFKSENPEVTKYKIVIENGTFSVPKDSLEIWRNIELSEDNVMQSLSNLFDGVNITLQYGDTILTQDNCTFQFNINTLFAFTVVD